MLERLTTGHITAIDQSPKMIALLDPLTGPKLTAIAQAIEDIDFGTRRFDAVFAVNVDFNLRLGNSWPALLRAVLTPTGRLVIAFEAPPGSGKADDFAFRSRTLLEASGFEVGQETAEGV